MDLCVFDWGIFASLLSAAATFIGAGVALWIFFQWKNQKGSEVIANEAKGLFKNIENAKTTFSIVFSDILKMAMHEKNPVDFPEEHFINFRTANLEIIKSLELIKFKNTDQETLNIIKEFIADYKFIAKFYHQNEPINLTDFFNAEEKYKATLDNLKYDLYQYSLYKKTI